MKHIYQITGMSCNGCRTAVEKALNTINGIDAIVSLNPPIATITMEKHVATEQMQQALKEAGNYTITMGNFNSSEPSSEVQSEKKSCC